MVKHGSGVSPTAYLSVCPCPKVTITTRQTSDPGCPKADTLVYYYYYYYLIPQVVKIPGVKN